MSFLIYSINSLPQWFTSYCCHYWQVNRFNDGVTISNLWQGNDSMMIDSFDC